MATAPMCLIFHSVEALVKGKGKNEETKLRELNDISLSL